MLKPNNLDWKLYEEITKYIYETLGKQSGVKIKGYGHACKVTGKSGVAHQIDVLTIHSDGIHEYQTAIECKYWKENVNKDIIMKVAEIVEDAAVNKGVIVSKQGFTVDAIAFAKYKNIGLVELREVEKNDFEGESGKLDLGILKVRTALTIRRPEILCIEIDSVEKNELEKEVWNNKYMIRLSNGNHVPFASYMKEFQDELHLQNKEWQIISKRFEVPGACLINERTNASVNVNVITLTGVLKKIDKGITQQFTLVDHVWLIMKTVFEQQTFVFSENGIIIKK